MFSHISPKLTTQYAARVATEPPRELRRHPKAIRYTLLAAFCWQRRQEITDNLIELLIQITHKMKTRAENKGDRTFLEEAKHVHGKSKYLVKIARVALNAPQGSIEDVIFPVVSPAVLADVIAEADVSKGYLAQVHQKLRGSYSQHYRTILPEILRVLNFQSGNAVHHPMIDALDLLRKYAHSKQPYYPQQEEVPIEDVIQPQWQELVVESDQRGNSRINRINYEMCLLQTLRKKLRCKEIWIEGADKYRDPDQDLPADFETERSRYYAMLRQPLNPNDLINQVRTALMQALTMLNDHLPANPSVRILRRGGGWISVSPLPPQAEPPNLRYLIAEVSH